MKKITLFFALMISLFSFGQSPIITMISDGDCFGGLPKVVEIYADGTVDFSNYSLIKSVNGGDFSDALNLADLGTVTNEFVYIYKDGTDDNDNSYFDANFPSATNKLETTSDAVNFNGDDPIRLVLDSDMSVVDQYGNQEDGTGTVWEYKDGYSKRNNGTTANGSFNQGDWTYNNGSLDGEGTCQSGTTFESIIVLGTYDAGAQACPLSVNVTGTSCDTETTGADSDTYTVTLTFSEGGTENYSFSVNVGTITLLDDPSTTVNGTILVEDIPEGTDLSYTITSTNCDINSTVNSPECEPSFNVNSIAALRAGTIGESYTLTSEAILTYQQDFRNQKYIKDATAAILIDDTNGNITTTYNRGDGITGITGELSEFNGVLQFLPESDPGAATSTGLSVAPQVITLSEFNNNPDTYESELIAFENVSFVEADGTVEFETGTNYTLTNGSDQVTKRTNFFAADYIETVIPQGTLSNIVGLASKFDNGTDPVVAQIFVRDLNDFEADLSTNNNAKLLFNLYPNPASNGQVSLQTETNSPVNVEVFDMLGKRAIATKVTNGQLNISALNAGLYLVKVTQNGVSTTKKLIVK
jgi:hypothetical protein